MNQEIGMRRMETMNNLFNTADNEYPVYHRHFNKPNLIISTYTIENVCCLVIVMRKQTINAGKVGNIENTFLKLAKEKLLVQDKK